MEESEKKKLSNYWYNRADSLHSSAVILYEKKNGKTDLLDPCLLLAGLSIEVISKAIIVRINRGFNDSKYSHHKLLDIIKDTGANLTTNQKITIELYEESVIWLSKYPFQKEQKNKDKAKFYYDDYRRKTRSLFKPVSATNNLQVITSDPDKWPILENYQAIWKELNSCYWNTPTDNPQEFGYQLKYEKKHSRIKKEE